VRLRIPALRVIDRLDDVVGGGTERTVAAHHRRRLANHGWGHVLEGRRRGWWATGDPAPRPGNRLDVLIDGEQALTALADEIAAARSHVHLAGWALDPDFAIRRDGAETTVRELLASVAERAEVRVLLWAGAPVPLIHPTRAEVREAAARLTRGTRIRCALDAHERPLHCHHEKIVVVDGRVAMVGGIDLTSLNGDRFDSTAHPYRSTVGWHDAAVRLTGPAVRDVADHFSMRWRETASEQLEDAVDDKPAGESTVQVVRTVPNSVYRSLPAGDFRLLDAYRGALASAERLIHLENQFLWAPEITEILACKLSQPPCDEFRLVVVLPARPRSGADDTRGQLALLAGHDAQGGGGRLLACTLFARDGARSSPVYVHAKIGIVDDRWLTVGSANLNDHSLFNDTEMNVVTDDRELARRTRLRLWAEHLERSPSDVDGPAHEVVDGLFLPISSEQLGRRSAGSPLTHRLVRQSFGSRRAERLLGPLQALVVDG
jgi:phosphatidylserine/phosphatidylglycerophosphate/cardiolipin synthase-like enzyme